MVRAGYLTAIVGLLIVFTLISGCAEQGGANNDTGNNTTVASIDVSAVPGIPLPESPGADMRPWFEYEVTEEYLIGKHPYAEPLRVRVWSGNETVDGAQAVHKKIDLTQYRDTHSYDVLVDKTSGKILSGNYTTSSMNAPYTTRLPAGSDYAATLGYLDIPARLSSGKAGVPEVAGCETILFDGASYQCTLYNRTYEDVVYTIWLNASLPWPVKAIAHPAGPEETVLRTYVLAGWNGTTSAGTGIPELIVRPGQSWLFKTDNLTWYSYLREEGPDSTAIKIEHSDVTYAGIPARYTKISSSQLNGNYAEDKEIYERKSDGRVLLGNVTTYSYGNPWNKLIGPGAYPGNYYEDVAGNNDVAAAFNADKDKTLKTAGSETIEHEGRQYICTMYYMRTQEASYTVWHNTSIPMPLKVVVKYNESYYTDTYRLTGWGKENVPGIPTPTPLPASATPTPVPGPSPLFDMDGITWYQYALATQVQDAVKHQKLRVEYRGSSFEHITGSGSVYLSGSKITSISQIWPEDDYFKNISVSESKPGEVASGVITIGRTDMQSSNYFNIDRRYAAEEIKKDVSTRFDAETDKTMQFAGYENIRYKGDLYNCTIKDVTVGGDSFRIWSNASLPLPPKIVASYEYPDQYFGHYGAETATGPCIYELLDYGREIPGSNA